MKLSQLIENNPLSQASWPDTLTARVVAPGQEPLLCGYALHQDLARHYRWPEVLFLSLTGELPPDELVPLLEIALISLSGVTVSEAPGNAALIAGLCGTTNSAATGIIALTLAEQARVTVARFLSLPRDERQAPSQDESIRALQETLTTRGFAMTLEARLGVAGAALSLLVRCGLSQAHQLEAAWLMARLPVALAECWQQPPGQFASYPTQLPRFAFQHPRCEDQ